MKELLHDSFLAVIRTNWNILQPPATIGQQLAAGMRMFVANITASGLELIALIGVAAYNWRLVLD